jgi:hypothetical protein
MPPRFAVGNRITGHQQLLATGAKYLAQRGDAVCLEGRLQGPDRRLGRGVIGGCGDVRRQGYTLSRNIW